MTDWRRAFAHNRFQFAPHLTLLIFAGPILLGLFGTLLPAFGIQPMLGINALDISTLDISTLGFSAWHNLFADPAFAKSLSLTLVTGFGATMIAVVIGFCGVALLHDSKAFALLRALLAPALAFPHASFAVGLAFLMAPSGWIARLLSPWATGWIQPPDLLIIRDPDGLALMISLALKESLFLILMIVGALGQINSAHLLRSARSMGYSSTYAWLKVVAPQVYTQVRLPIYAMLASALAIVDMAIILGPTSPPSLAPMTLDWFRKLDSTRQMMASAASILQLLIVVGAVMLWRGGERFSNRITRRWLSDGTRRGMVGAICMGAGSIGVSLALLASIGAFIMLFIWSFAWQWRWPDALPASWSFSNWAGAGNDLIMLTGRTALIGLFASSIATMLAIFCLEAGVGRAKPRWLALIYVPLLMPQISFLFGIQLMWNRLWLDGSLVAVTLTHLLFVLPYVFLVLSDPYRALDPRIAIAARSLGSGQLRTLMKVKLPLLARPVALALAIGFAVSVGQYLPTIFAGAGRVDTLTTEAVALASGADRRLAGVTAFALTALPFIALLLAYIVPHHLGPLGRLGRLG